jgi:hypothetical protein
MLAGHSRIHVAPETWFVERLVRSLPIERRLMPAEIERAVRIMVDDYRWPDMEISADEFRRAVAALHRPKLVDVINLVYSRQLEMSGKSRCGDKTPVYYQIIPELVRLYPGAKFIFLVRDGRDVAISHINAGWPSRCYDGDRFVWTRALRCREAAGKAGLADRILDIRYEDLVNAPEATIRRICVFLGEDYEPAMLDHRERTDMVPERERQIHTKLDQPISSDAIGVWRAKLSAAECFVMEACLHRDLAAWGYELRFAHAAWRPVLFFARSILIGLAPVVHRIVPYARRRNYLPRTLAYF